MLRSNVLSDGERGAKRQVEPESKENYTVYILRTSANTLYIGQTNNLEKRLKEHQGKTIKSAKYTKYFDSCELVYSENYTTRVGAMKREWQLKKWTKEKKEALVARNLELLKML